MSDHVTWKQLARCCAAEANIKYAGRQSGVWSILDLGALVAFHNAWNAKDRQLRPAITTIFYSLLHAAGVEPVAQSAFPDSGPNAGASYVAVLLASAELRAAIQSMWAAAELAAINEATSNQEGE